MSQNQRVTEIEEKIVKEGPKRECIFCIDRERHRFWQFTPIADRFYKEWLAKQGMTKCNHKEANEPTIWLADELACTLLGYVFDNYLERQSDEEFKEKIMRDGSIMIPAFEKEHADKLKEFPLSVFSGYSLWLIKAKRDCYPAFLEEVKSMYGA